MLLLDRAMKQFVKSGSMFEHVGVRHYEEYLAPSL